MDNNLDENHINTQTNNNINVLNTVKRQYQPIKYVNITPIRLNDIKKELAESTTPPPLVQPSSNDNSLSPIVEENESFLTTTKPTITIQETSFERDFNLLSFNSSGIMDIDDDNKENEQPTKIQCTISLKDIIQTPRNSTGSILNNNKAKFILSSSKPHQLLNNYIKNDFKRLTVNGNEFIILKQLGKGGSSEVFLCFNQITKEQYAIKCVSLKDPLIAEDFLKEVKILKQLQNCDRIIKLYDYEINNDKLLLVLEAGGDDLSTVLKNQSILPKYKLICYIMEILYAVKQIHTNGIIHADLKPANFLQFNDFRLKLIDFGISTFIQINNNDNNMTTSVFKNVAEGSINYISPEALINQDLTNIYSPTKRNGQYKLNFKSDIWSLGCIFYQLIYKRTPYQHINNIMKRMCAICDPDYKISYPTPPSTSSSWVSFKIIEIIKKCLQHNMKLRPTIDELIKDCESL